MSSRDADTLQTDVLGTGVVAVVVMVVQLPCTQICPDEHPVFCATIDEVRGNVVLVLGTHLY